MTEGPRVGSRWVQRKNPYKRRVIVVEKVYTSAKFGTLMIRFKAVGTSSSQSAAVQWLYREFESID